MYHYWTVGHVILNTQWIKKHGAQWRSIRIEITADDEPFACCEIDLIYDPRNQGFEDWVDDLKTDEILTLDEILRRFKHETGHVLETLL